MTWKMIYAFLKSIVLGTIFGALSLGIIGFLLAGREGFVNLAIWGTVLGIAGGTMSGATVMMARYSESIGTNYGHWRNEEEANKERP